MTEQPDFNWVIIRLWTDPHTWATGKDDEWIDPDTLESHPLLAPALEKLAWAGRQTDALEANIKQAFPAGDPSNCAMVRAKLDTKSGYHVFSVCKLPDPPPGFVKDFPHAVSDIAKNLQAALGQFAWALACDLAQGEPSDPKGISFPIIDDPNDMGKRHVTRAKAQILDDHWRFIKNFQPHQGVNGRTDSWMGDYVHPFAYINDLANDDKHHFTRAVFLQSGQFNFVKIEVIRDAGGGWQALGLGEPLELDLKVVQARLVAGTEPEIDPAGVLTPEIALGDGRIAVPELRRMVRFTHLMFSEFYRQFPPP